MDENTLLILIRCEMCARNELFCVRSLRLGIVIAVEASSILTNMVYNSISTVHRMNSH